MNELFSIDLFKDHLRTLALGRHLRYERSTDSTMRLAQEAAERGDPHGSLFLAEEQTDGRGRQGRSFFSPAGENLYFTILIRGSRASLRMIPLAVPLAVCSAIRSTGLNAAIKWPNDIWVGGRKVSGILIDVQEAGEEFLVMPGIGINVNTDFSDVDELREVATSIRSSLGRKVARELLLASVCNELEEWLAAPRDKVVDGYRDASLVIGRAVEVLPRSGTPFVGIARAVELDGALRVRRDDGETEVVRAADVSLRPADGVDPSP
ncbi:MAG: biotin--[acetyl-CoA-carboxylase] ligase [Dehalococcoidia bacterium]